MMPEKRWSRCKGQRTIKANFEWVFSTTGERRQRALSRRLICSQRGGKRSKERKRRTTGRNGQATDAIANERGHSKVGGIEREKITKEIYFKDYFWDEDQVNQVANDLNQEGEESDEVWLTIDLNLKCQNKSRHYDCVCARMTTRTTTAAAG